MMTKKIDDKVLDAPIPEAVLKPLTTSTWKCDEFSLTKFDRGLEIHRADDVRNGCAPAYHVGMINTLRQNELKEMLSADAIDPGFVSPDCEWVNQHLCSSLEQFYAEVTQSWKAHLRRMDHIRGTSSGRIAVGQHTARQQEQSPTVRKNGSAA